jgi:hypothetical protein
MLYGEKFTNLELIMLQLLMSDDTEFNDLEADFDFF